MISVPTTWTTDREGKGSEWSDTGHAVQNLAGRQGCAIMIESPIWSLRNDRSIDRRSEKTRFSDRSMIERWSIDEIAVIDKINKFIKITEVWKLNRSHRGSLEIKSLSRARHLLLSPLRNFFVRSSLASSEALVLRLNIFVRSFGAIFLLVRTSVQFFSFQLL